jgi:hypothetical protein
MSPHLRAISAISLGLTLVFGSAGCDKESSSSSNPAPKGPTTTSVPTTAPAVLTTATATPTTMGSLVGKWKVTAVERAGRRSSDVLNDFSRDEFTIRPDGTFRSRNDWVGEFGGAWALNGSVVTLTPDPSGISIPLETRTLTIDGSRLRRERAGWTGMYERQSADADRPQFKMTVADYLADLTGDESVLKTKYLGKTIELDGVVIEADYSYVMIYGPQATADESGHAVMCNTIEKEPFAHLGPGQTVTLRGEVRDEMLVVEAELVRAGPPTLVTISAEDLARAFASDPMSTARKYTDRKLTGKTLLLTGPVLAIKPNTDGDLSNVIVGTADAYVTCIFPTQKYAMDKIKTLKRGEEIKVVGVYSNSTTSGISPKLYESRLVTGK